MARQDTGSGTAPRAEYGSRSALILWALFLLSCLVIAIAGRVYFDAQRRDIVARKSAELSAVRDLKIAQIVEWRVDLLEDGRSIAADPSLRDELDTWMTDPTDVRAAEAVRTWMNSLVAQGGYVGVSVIAPGGTNWLSTEGTAALDPIERSEAERAMGSTETTLTDMFLDPGTGTPRLDVVTPLVGGQHRTRGVVILRHDPSAYLFPLLEKWPTNSASSETLLARPEGANILYLNNLRFRPDSALTSTASMKNTELLAVQAVTTPAHVGEGTDYRGRPVFGAVGRVGDSPWYLVAKVDRAEAFDGVTQSQWLITIFAVLLICMVGVGLLYAWRQRTIEYYRGQLEVERAEALLSEQYNLLTRYASDAVMLADENLRIIQANERAIALYGYPEEELMAMSLDDLLQQDEDGLTTSLATALRGDSGGLIELRQHRADGSVLYSEMTTQAILLDDLVLYLTITRDATERKAAEDALRKSETRYRSLLVNLPAGVVVHAPDTTIILSNPMASVLLGLSADQLQGRSAMDPAWRFLAETGEPMPLDRYPVNHVISSGEALKGLTVGVLRDGDTEPAWLLCNAYPVHDSGGSLAQIVVTFIDITDRKQAEEELSARTDDLQRSNADLEKFAYIASHDLQEPLRMVASYTQLLQQRYRGRLDSDADEFIEYAVDGATRMQRLINELLAYSRVGSQGAPFVETDLEVVLAGVLRVLELTIADNAAVITHDPLPTVTCDPMQIGQVFQNLLANAIKFRRADPPRIHIGAENAAGEWVFTVRDNGLGIEPEYFDRIFVIFQRLQSRATYPGTGMGLAICKRIIERHGGCTWLESEPGEGSTFYFTLRDNGEDWHADHA